MRQVIVGATGVGDCAYYSQMMLRHMRGATLAASLLSFAAARFSSADEGTPRYSVWRDVDPMVVQQGFQLGGRIGISSPSGALSGSSPTGLHDLAPLWFPIGVDVGYRFNRTSYLGLTLVWAPGESTTNLALCPSASCSAQDTQIRLDARRYLAPDGKVGWWMAAGAGWEVATYSRTMGSNVTTATFMGPVFLDLQLGFDIRRGVNAWGPYLGVTVGGFTTEALNPAYGSPSIGSLAGHVWTTFGIRGSYGPR